MKVSIGVVALNEEKTLPSLFEDFKLQTYPHDKIEIILIIPSDSILIGIGLLSPLTDMSSTFHPSSPESKVCLP